LLAGLGMGSQARVFWACLAGFTIEKVNLDLRFTVDLSVTYLANTTAPNPYKSIFVRIAKIALGH
jgi:hypothetical protein